MLVLQLNRVFINLYNPQNMKRLLKTINKNINKREKAETLKWKTRRYCWHIEIMTYSVKINQDRSLPKQLR